MSSLNKKIALIGFSDSINESLKTKLELKKMTLFIENFDQYNSIEKILNNNVDFIVLNDNSIQNENVDSIIENLLSSKEIPFILVAKEINDEIEQIIKTKKYFSVVSYCENNEILAKNIESGIIYGLNLIQKIVILEEELSMNKMQVEELSETNAHLITATFRERSLKKELEASKSLIEEQSKKILDSINYSLRIQQSIIPSRDIFDQYLGKHFVYYKPKDVVSGDFPWLFVKGDYVYFAAVDCTGHGVPGAMMSMIGNLLLNAIVNNGDVCKTPSDILAELHKAVVKTLKQDAEGNKAADGMDASLCRINLKEKELLFSGAHLPLFFLRDGELEVIKGDKFPVGGMQYRNRNTYSDHTIKIEEKDRFFIFSDGIIDQIGGPEKMKWMSSSLKDFVVEQKDVPMEDIKNNIHETFENFKGTNKQVDDVLLIGVEI